MSLGQIIRQRRDELNLTLDFVSSRIGYSKPYLSTIETGKVKNPPSDQCLRKLEQVLELDPGSLVQVAHLGKMSPELRNEYEQTQAQHQKWREVIKSIVEQKADPAQLDELLKHDTPDAEGAKAAFKAGAMVPIINKVAAGYPTDFDDLDYPVGVADDYVRCPDLHDPNAFGVRVVGDSMEPKFFEGDIVVFSPAAQVHNGDDCFIRFSMPHETTFKRIFFEDEGKIRLQPRNEKYPPSTIDGKRVNGVYRAVVRFERL